MKNNNQKKYIAMSAIFMSYGVCEDKNEEAIGHLISNIYDNFLLIL